jgi:hypothetical protein
VGVVVFTVGGEQVVNGERKYCSTLSGYGNRVADRDCLCWGCLCGWIICMVRRKS